MKATLIIALVCALGIRPALAVTLISDVGQTSDGVGNLLNTQYRYATDFTTNGVGSTITGGTFTMDNLDNITHNFIASIYTDNSGTPGTLVGTFNSFAVSASTGNGNYSSTPNGSINLAANTTYWEVMQMVEGLGTGSAPQVIYTSSQNTDSGSLFSFVPLTALKTSSNSGSSYSDVTAFGSSIQGNYQFALTGTQVPEPSRMALTCGACAALLARRRRRMPA